jgi:SAM-dependent methyltransferase
MLSEILKLACVAAYCLLGYFVLRILYEIITWRKIPNARTAPGMRRHIIKRLAQDRAAKSANGSYSVIDLGSGNGQLSRSIARALPDATVLGLELSPVGHMRAKLRQKLRGPANVAYAQADFLAYDLSGADAIVMFLSAKMMHRLRDKLQVELKPGALVLSNTFALGGDWQPLEVVKFWSLFYIDTALFVYRKA